MSTLTTIDFHGDSLFAVHAEGSPFVAAKPISDTFGLSWTGQLERIKRDTVLNEGIRVIRIPSPGGAQEMVCLPLKLVPGWLFGIDERRVKPELVDRVLLYKRECHDVLASHFLGHHAATGTAEVIPPWDLPDAKPFHLWTTGEINSQCRVAELYGSNRGSEACWAYMMYRGFPPLAVLFNGRPPVPGQMTLPYDAPVRGE